jgi:hypothetical protein
MVLELASSRTYPVSVERAYDGVLTTPLPELFSKRYAAIPPIREVRDQQGAWGTLGQTRTIRLADGGTMRETLTSVDRPHSFGYRISDVSGPMKPLVTEVAGEWRFEPAGDGVRITWAWTVHRAVVSAGSRCRSSRGCGGATRARPWSGSRASSSPDLDRLSAGPNRFGGPVRRVLTFPTASLGTQIWGCGAVGSASRSQ